MERGIQSSSERVLETGRRSRGSKGRPKGTSRRSKPKPRDQRKRITERKREERRERESGKAGIQESERDEVSCASGTCKAAEQEEDGGKGEGELGRNGREAIEGRAEAREA